MSVPTLMTSVMFVGLSGVFVEGGALSLAVCAGGRQPQAISCVYVTLASSPDAFIQTLPRADFV
jgi:hypothetical protein